MTSRTRKTVTVIRYLVASGIPVALAWGYELGKEGFNALMRDPWSNPFSWFILSLAGAQAMCQAVGALLNADLAKGTGLNVPEQPVQPFGRGGKEPSGPNS
jgi:hypothetical protein